MRPSLPPASTSGRILNDLKFQGSLPTYSKLSLNAATGRLHARKHKPKLKKQRRGGCQPKQPGDMLQIDTIVKFIYVIRRCVITAVNYHLSVCHCLRLQRVPVAPMPQTSWSNSKLLHCSYSNGPPRQR